jgi:hypothetical protein
LYGLYLYGLDDPAFHILLSKMSRPVPAPTQPSIYVIGTGGSSLERSKAAGDKSGTIPLLLHGVPRDKCVPLHITATERC